MTDALPQPQSPDGNVTPQNADPTYFPAAIRDNYTVHGLFKDVKHSTLYGATHKQSGTPVLIKSIHVERIGSWKDLDLFIVQSAILKNLEHPGIPRLFDAVDDQENGRFHLVQQYIDAPSLKTVLEKRGCLPVEQCLDIALQLCDILEALAAFSPPVVHRDIKPSNILLNRDKRVHLIDFDLATAQHTENRGSTIAGTVGYMPPEQYLGKAGPAADVYAVFATVLHLLTGTDPGKMDTEDFRLQFEPHLPPGTNPNLIRLFNDTLQPLEERRLTSLRSIRMRIEGIVGRDTPDIVRSGRFKVYELHTCIRAKSEYNRYLLSLPPVPRPYSKVELYNALGIHANAPDYEEERRRSTWIGLIATVLALTVLFLLAYELIIPLFIFVAIVILPALLLFGYRNRRMRKLNWKVNKIYDALCNWEQNTAIISDIEKVKYGFWASFLEKDAEEYNVYFFHKVKGRVYNVKQNIASSCFFQTYNTDVLAALYEQCGRNLALKVGDEVSIIYNPKSPKRVLIYPGPVRYYFYHPKLWR